MPESSITGKSNIYNFAELHESCELEGARKLNYTSQTFIIAELHETCELEGARKLNILVSQTFINLLCLMKNVDWKVP